MCCVALIGGFGGGGGGSLEKKAEMKPSQPKGEQQGGSASGKKEFPNFVVGTAHD